MTRLWFLTYEFHPVLVGSIRFKYFPLVQVFINKKKFNQPQGSLRHPSIWQFYRWLQRHFSIYDEFSESSKIENVSKFERISVKISYFIFLRLQTGSLSKYLINFCEIWASPVKASIHISFWPPELSQRLIRIIHVLKRDFIR